MHDMFNMDGASKFHFDWKDLVKSGLSVKDAIAPTAFAFKNSRTFQMGGIFCAASFLSITASDISDQLLKDFLDMDSSQIVTMHIQSVDQNRAIKTVKRTITELDRSKIEEQKKAIRAGYDIDIIPSDLATYGRDAKALLKELQSQNERMFLVTFLVLNTGRTEQELENSVFQASSIAQKHNCNLCRLDFQQEQGLMSSLPLADCQIEIQRGLTTSSTAIFIPFTTQELYQSGKESLYYGLNALSNNLIMVDRKKLKNPNGLILGTPGSGKSFSAKREIANAFLVTDDDIIINDPEGEYSPLVNRLKGQVIKISPNSTQFINPMDINAENEWHILPADPDVKNFSYTVVDGEVYYRENSVMTQVELSDTAKGRVTGMVELRQIVNELIDQQLNDYPDADIKATQEKLNTTYDAFSAKYGLLNDRKNGRLFEQDSSYYLLCSLENLDEQGQLKSKAAMFTKRTIRPERTVTSVETPTEALAVSIGERGRVDLPYMAELLGTPGEYERITSDLSGVIFKDPGTDPTDPEAGWQMADEYLSGNVRAKLRMAQLAAETNPEFAVNVAALEKAQPKDLEASEIDVRLGATWLAPEIIQKFMAEIFQIPYYLRHAVKVRYSHYTAEWRIEGKSAMGRGDIISSETYGTSRANAYKILEDTLNLKDVRIYDTIKDEEGRPKRVLNKTDTMLAQQKQQIIKDAFANWIWQDPQRRIALVKQYNELFNSNRPREYDGSHIHLVGMNPEITLREHQRNAIAHVLYGGNTLLAHEVGAGKTFEMAASAMEAKRLGLSPTMAGKSVWMFA